MAAQGGGIGDRLAGCAQPGSASVGEVVQRVEGLTDAGVVGGEHDVTLSVGVHPSVGFDNLAVGADAVGHGGPVVAGEGFADALGEAARRFTVG